ncbi:MAG TPA: glycosyltransferase family 39 protein [Solirubrobacteraceae bacterium]
MSRLAWRHVALATVLALSTVMNIYKLSQNGYANIFYSAGVKSMLRSLHNFVFVSFDAGGLITVDKPPLALWVQAVSAKLFGFTPLSLLLPEAIAGVLAVALLYRILLTRLGPVAAIAGALTFAVFPSFVAVSRTNGVDPLLILLLLLACAATLRAVESGRWRTLLLAGALVGLAFNTKTLAAYLVVPGMALAYLACAPGSLLRRTTQLLAAGLVLVLVSASWIAFVELTPASKRPFVGSSTDNTELGLTFAYNGFGRVEGQVGGPGHIPVRAGGALSLAGHHPRGAVAGRNAKGHGVLPPFSRKAPRRRPGGRYALPIAFGTAPGPLRLFELGLGDQGGWIIPFALFATLALALLVLLGRGPEDRRRRDPRLAVLLVLGGWFLVEAVVLSLSKGIVHPYYASALAPGAAAMTGAGAVAFVETGAYRMLRMALLPIAVAATVVVQIVLLKRAEYMQWFYPLLIVGAGVGVSAVACAAIVLRRWVTPAIALILAVLLVAPTAYSATTWLAPAEVTFPAAGPLQANGPGGVGLGPSSLRAYRSLLGYLKSHEPGTRWPVLTDASNVAAPLILMGMDAGALGGYGGIDPSLDGPGLARLVADGEARYVLLGGVYSTRGGNRATAAVLRVCRELPPRTWLAPHAATHGLVLFDCAGRERRLAAA